MCLFRTQARVNGDIIHGASFLKVPLRPRVCSITLVRAARSWKEWAVSRYQGVAKTVRLAARPSADPLIVVPAFARIIAGVPEAILGTAKGHPRATRDGAVFVSWPSRARML